MCHLDTLNGRSLRLCVTKRWSPTETEDYTSRVYAVIYEESGGCTASAYYLHNKMFRTRQFRARLSPLAEAGTYLEFRFVEKANKFYETHQTR